MGYRKFSADFLFTGDQLLGNDVVLVTTEEGCIEKIIPINEAGENVVHYPGLLCPGFVNTHCHLELSHMKGKIAGNTGLVEFLLHVMTQRITMQEEIQDAMSKAIVEMYNTGTVAVADICNTTDSVSVKAISNMHWHNFIEVSGFSVAPENRFQFAENTRRHFEINQPLTPATNGLQNRISITPHAPYSVSDKLFTLISDAAGDIVTIHNQEAEAENEWYRHKSGTLTGLYSALNIDTSFFQPSGKSSIQTCLPLLPRPSNVLLVHNCATSNEDVQFIKTHKAITGQQVYFVTCINANLYIQSMRPPLQMLIDNGCTITLGTDSLASNHTLNLMEEMKTIQREFPNVKLEEILKWASFNGARALKLQDIVGSFQPGLRPGVVHISNTENKMLTDRSQSKRVG